MIVDYLYAAHKRNEASDMSFFSLSLERMGLRRECTEGTSAERRDPCIRSRTGESIMPTQTHKRPSLRPAVESLIASCVPVLKGGGTLPLARVVEAAAGGLLKPSVVQTLEGRGDLVFERRGGTVRFANEGRRAQIAFRRFDLVIPTRISGHAFEISGGVEFRFDPKETFRASKFLMSVNLERLEVTSERIVVNVQGGLFDQHIALV